MSIGAPTGGATVAGVLTISGTSADNTSVSKVEVRIDTGSYNLASGTTTWSRSWDTTSANDGAHTITARATDTAGNASTTSVSVTVNNAATSSDITLSNPAVSGPLAPLTRGRMAVLGDVTALLYQGGSVFQPWVYLRNAVTGATSHVMLPVSPALLDEWKTATAVLTAGNQLWVMGGSTRQYLRRYQLSGTPLPTSATLVSTRSYGDDDSRPGDFIGLASGGLIGTWHQQGVSGPQGIGFVYRDPSGTWMTIEGVQFMPSRSSKQVLAQHPSDGRVWMFANPDAWGGIGVARLVESAGAISIEWTDASFIDSSSDGAFGSDPENPDLAVAPDPATGSIALAYQGATRKIFQVSPIVTGSYPVVARISAAGAKSFIQLPIYVERVSSIGLVVTSEATWLAYRPINADLTFSDLYTSKYAGGSWGAPEIVGALIAPHERVNFAVGRPEFATRLTDAKIHLLPRA